MHLVADHCRGYYFSGGDLAVAVCDKERTIIERCGWPGPLSFDPTQLSVHERVDIMGGRSPDLARMLREAYMAGVESTRAGVEWRAPRRR